jgi:hypothetical protein
VVEAIRRGTGLELASTDPAAGAGPGTPFATYVFATPMGEGSALDLPYYAVWLDRYAGSERAAVALGAVTTDLGPGYRDVKELPADATGLGDNARVFSYRFSEPDEPEEQGYMVLSQVGDTTIRLLVDSPIGVREEGVIALDEQQVACVQSAAPCPKVGLEDARTSVRVGPGRSA